MAKCHACGKDVKDCPGHEVKNKCHVCGKPVAECPGHGS